MALQPYYMASSGTTTSTIAMWTSVSTSATAYATVATRVVFSIIEIMISIMFINLVVLRWHVHISDVTNMSLIFFWIKLQLKLPNFLTQQRSHDTMLMGLGRTKPPQHGAGLDPLVTWAD